MKAIEDSRLIQNAEKEITLRLRYNLNLSFSAKACV